MIWAAIQSSIILLLAFCAAGILRRQSAAVRHLIWAAGLIAALVAPAISPLLPAWVEHPRMGIENWELRDRHQILGLQNLVSVPQFPDSLAPTLPPSRNLPAVGEIAFQVWLLGVSIGVILLLAGGARIGWLMLRAKPLTGRRWTTATADTAGMLKVKRQVRLLRNQRAVLGTCGIFRPRILLPRDADDWPEDRLQIVLAHELAHIKRLDWLVQILAESARAIYWFNPLFWTACRRLRRESEHACDDVVLNLGIDARDYAAHLLELARTLKNSGRAWSPVLAMAQLPNLERRFIAMLNSSLNHRPATRRAVLVVCVAAMCVTLPLAAMRASEQPQQAVSSPPVLVTASAPAPKAALPLAPSVAAKRSPAARRRAAPAQGLADGSLSGRVYDGTGAVIPGVTVTVSSLVSAPHSIVETEVAETRTGDVGNFTFLALPAGQYSLKAALPGFIAFRKPWLEIKPSQTLQQNVILSVGSIAERVTVTAAGQPRPPLPPGTPQRIRVGGNVIAANLISQVRPIYPQTARQAGVEGTVHLQGIIGPDGTLIALRALSSNDADLTNAALEAVRQWRYRPTLLNNVPVEVLTDIDVEFKLSQ